MSRVPTKRPKLFVAMGKSGSEVTAFTEASLMLSTSDDPTARLDELAEQLSAIGGGDSYGHGANKIVSAPDGIAHAILDYLYGRNTATQVPIKQKNTLDICPDCKRPTLAKGGNCDVCEACGYSKC